VRKQANHRANQGICRRTDGYGDLFLVPDTTRSRRNSEPSAGLAQDVGVAVACREQFAALKAAWVELSEARIGTSKNEVGNTTSQGRRQLEAMAAGPGVHKHPLRDLADHWLPVRADVVEARPSAPGLRIVHEWVPPG